MLGRKAIHHTSRAGKRKWQLEQEHSGEEEEAAPPRPQPAAAPEPPPASPGAGGADDDIDDDDEEGSEGGRRKRFAWMDSGDEVSEGGEDEDGPKPAAAAPEPFPPLPPAGPVSGGPLPPLPAAAAAAPVRLGAAPLLASARPGALRPALRPPCVLPPGCTLPRLTAEHLALMAQISVTRSVEEMWQLVEARGEELAAAHAATLLHRLSLLTGGKAEQRLEKSGSFAKLSNRVDELLATAEGRASFLPADLAMVVAALAKVVSLPAKEGALGRIFADVADEVEARIAAEPAAFTPPMLGDLAWGVSRSGETVNGAARAVVAPALRRFFGAVIEAAQPRLPEMACQDLANLAMAYADATREDADTLLRGIFEQARQRLAYHPPPTNALFSASVVPAAVPPVQQRVVPPPPPAVLPASEGEPEVAQPAQQAQSAPEEQERPPQWQQSGQWKFTGAQICEIASAASKHINLYEPRLFDLVAKQFLQRLQEMTTEQLRKLRDAFDIVRHDRDFEFLRSMKLLLKQREVSRSCKAFRNGNCKFGDRCVYSHEE